MSIPRWMQIMEYIRRWKPIPRLFIIVYMYLVFETVTWYMTLTEPTAEQTAFISAVIGVGAAWFGIFLNNINRPEVDCKDEEEK